ncbi:hypothetical protein K435DRAFT_393405 [Dendrothele bispora CBS 962.96]|uniref:Uncharacterized protein n=1 Tax=Dendrothele bispora (strain CBS 962.96) TaxID=1314807 RepID=A0A4S8L8R1_DENBC|nr:hypothetical protein K435DRAFT_393405 [Dendrothele bispora CBS 962.96]
MSKAFPGSVVLSQDSPGDTALSAPPHLAPNHTSRRTLSTVHPEPGTWCPVIGTPFNQDDALKELDLLSSGCTDKQEITNLNDGQQRTFSSASSLFLKSSLL